MAGNDLRIRIIGKLDTNLTTVEINKQLASIEKKINKLKLSVNIDSSKFNNVLKEFTQVQNKLKNNKTSVVSDKDANKVKEIYSSIDKAVEKYKQFGSIKIDRSFNPATKELEKFQLTITKANGEVEKLKFQLASLKGAHGIDGFALTGRSTADNTAKIREQQMQQQQKISRQVTQSMLQDQETLTQGFKKLFDQGKIGQSTFDKFNNSIKSAKNIQELDKLQQKLNRITDSANNKQTQQKLISDAQTLLRTHSKTADTKGLNNLITSLQRIPPNAKNAANSLAQAQTQLRNFQSQAREAARSSMTIMDAFRTAMVNFAVYSGNIIDY